MRQWFNRLSFCVPRATKSTIENGYLAKNNQVLFNGNLKGVFAKTVRPVGPPKFFNENNPENISQQKHVHVHIQF